MIEDDKNELYGEAGNIIKANFSRLAKLKGA